MLQKISVAETDLRKAFGEAGIEYDAGHEKKLKDAVFLDIKTVLEKEAPSTKPDIHLAQFADGEEKFWAVYKTDHGEKEWLGYQLDSAFNVRRSPVTVMKDLDLGAGAVSEFVTGRESSKFDWRNDMSPDEMSRVADFHFIIGETDENWMNCFATPDGRLVTLDRGEAFTTSHKPYTAVIKKALAGKHPVSADVLAAAERFLASPGLRHAVKKAFEAAFPEDGGRRFEAMMKRIEIYIHHKGLPPDLEPKAARKK